MNFYFLSSFRIIDYSLKIYDQYLWQVIKICAFTDLFHFLLAFFTKIINNHLFLCKFSQTIFKGLMTLNFHRKAIIILVLFYPISTFLAFYKIKLFYLQDRGKLFEFIFFFKRFLRILYQSIQKLMCIFLYSRIYRHSFKILERETKIIRHNIFLLAILEIVV